MWRRKPPLTQIQTADLEPMAHDALNLTHRNVNASLNFDNNRLRRHATHRTRTRTRTPIDVGSFDFNDDKRTHD